MQGSSTVAETGEFALIEQMLAAARAHPAPPALGAGDDAAVVPLSFFSPQNSLVVTTDVMVEGRHFCWDYGTPEDLGWKLLAVNLSDLAAMGARPIGCTLTVQASRSLPAERLLGLARGIGMLARKFAVPLIGGDTTEGPECAFGITAFGAVDVPLLRSGARPGDDLWVSGTIGGGGAGLKSYTVPGLVTASAEECRSRYVRPSPRIALGRVLSEGGLSRCAIDVSDGLIQDAGHIAARSGVRVDVELAQLALTPGTAELGLSVFDAVSSGDDYELLFTAAPADRERIAGLHREFPDVPACCRIGSVSAGSAGEVMLHTAEGQIVSAGAGSGFRGGYRHFASNPHALPAGHGRKED